MALDQTRPIFTLQITDGLNAEELYEGYLKEHGTWFRLKGDVSGKGRQEEVVRPIAIQRLNNSDPSDIRIEGQMIGYNRNCEVHYSAETRTGELRWQKRDR